MYRTIFNTAFIKSSTLMLSRVEVDISWDKKHQFPRDFKAEVLFFTLLLVTGHIIF